MVRRALLMGLFSFSVTFLISPSHVWAQQSETQSFDSEASAAAAGWSDNGLNRDDDLGTDFGFSTSNNAGGTPGEAGGLFPRIQSPVAYYGDTDLGGTLTLDNGLVASGKLVMENLNFDGEVWLGWFDAEDEPDRTDFIGLHFREPNGATQPDFRGLASYLLEDGTVDNGDFIAVPEGELLDFSIVYDPDGGFGDGELEITITNRDSGDSVNQTNDLTDLDRDIGAEFNAFGFTTSGGAGSNVPERLAEIYIDDLTYTSLQSTMRGDFNSDGALDASDIDALTDAVNLGTNPPGFDLTADGAVDQEDRRVWIKDVRKTWIGDSNLDGEFNSSDFVQVFQNGEYEDTVVGNSTWADGDWNGDMEFSSADFVVAFQDGGFEQGPAANGVPEPTGLAFLALGMIGLLARRPRSSGGKRRKRMYASSTGVTDTSTIH